MSFNMFEDGLAQWPEFFQCLPYLNDDVPVRAKSGVGVYCGRILVFLAVLDHALIVTKYSDFPWDRDGVFNAHQDDESEY